jgi:hypothetical protein
MALVADFFPPSVTPTLAAPGGQFCNLNRWSILIGALNLFLIAKKIK